MAFDAHSYARSPALYPAIREQRGTGWGRERYKTPLANYISRHGVGCTPPLARCGSGVFEQAAQNGEHEEICLGSRGRTGCGVAEGTMSNIEPRIEQAFLSVPQVVVWVIIGLGALYVVGMLLEHFIEDFLL